jgi:protein gp37
MAETAIEWATHSWNPTTGCDRVTRGCRNCYALRMAGRAKLMGNARYQLDGDSKSSGPGFGLQMWEDRLAEPARWRKPRVVFVDSMSDLFHPEVTDEFIWRVWKAMAGASRHTFLVLTKRPDRMRELVNSWHRGVDARGQKFVTQPLPNVWLGTSIENRHVVKRAEELRQTLAARRFISAEPLVGALSGLSLEAIDWLIVGGESGPGAVPMHPLWARSLRDACLDSICPLCAGAVDVGGWHCPRCAGTGRETLFFFKQWGASGRSRRSARSSSVRTAATTRRASIIAAPRASRRMGIRTSCSSRTRSIRAASSTAPSGTSARRSRTSSPTVRCRGPGRRLTHPRPLRRS